MCHSNRLKKGLRVLVVDSHTDSSDLLRMLLAEYGIETLVASSVNEALDAMQQTCPDLLISEIVLPDEDGYSLISKVKAFESAYRVRIPSLALTVCASTHDQLHALEAGFCSHLSKPFDFDELITTIVYLAGQSQASAVVCC